MKIPVKTVEEHVQAEDVQEEQQQEVNNESTPPEGHDEAPVDAQNGEEEIEDAPIAREEDDVVLEPEVMPETEEDDVTRLQHALEAKEQEAKEHYDARLRLQAEFDNFKKRKERESSDFRKYANADFIKELLVVVDDFDRAIAAAEQTHKLEDFLQGVEMIFEKFLGVLKRKGIKEIDAEVGQPFNPEVHEAMTQIETDEFEEGTVAAVFQKGYYLHDRVLVAPKVAVAKAK